MEALRINVRLEGAAFYSGGGTTEELEPGPELARILRRIADELEAGHEPRHYITILDLNGNDVGRWAIKPTGEEA